MQRSRSSDAIQKLERELNLSERILSGDVDGATEESIDKARECVEKHATLLDILTKKYKNIDHVVNKHKQRESFFSKKIRLSMLKTPAKTRMTLTSSEQFPIDAFTADLSNPDLFSEVYPMAFLSAAIFALAEIRRAARHGRIDDAGQDTLSTPVASRSILKVFQANQSYFQKKLKGVDYELMLSILRNTDVDDDTTSSDLQNQKKRALALVNAMSIEYFADDHEETEAMYMITRNPINKRIALIFRGSITIKDWVEDSKMIVSEIKNPVSDRPNQPPTIGVHLGFGEYLHTESTSNSIRTDFDTTNTQTIQQQPTTVATAVRPDDDNTSTFSTETGKYQKRDSTEELLTYLGLDLLSLKETQRNLWGIMKSTWRSSSPESQKEDTVVADPPSRTSISSEDGAAKKSRIGRILDEIKHLQQTYDDYRVYVSGHSLGGSLALLAALELAAKIGKKGLPVTAVCMASPRSGTEDLRDAVEVLEREGKMRCLSVQGRFDIVPMMPNSFLDRGTKRRFCHSGFELILRSEECKFYMRRCAQNDEKYLQRMGLALIRVDKTNERHHFTTYLKNLEALERSLRKLYLNDFYDKYVEESVFTTSAKKMTPLKVRAARGRHSVAVVRLPPKTELKKNLSADDLQKLEREESFPEDSEREESFAEDYE